MKNIIEVVKDWICKAESDLLNSEIILESDKTNKPYDTVCSHCQQAIEKFLKAYLFFNRVPFPKTHVLEDLANECGKKDKEFLKFIDRISVLSDYAVDVRYPDDYYIPDIEETQKAYEVAVEIKKMVLGKIKIEG